MRLTPAILRSTYAFVRSTLPFSRWHLPEADEVEFHVLRKTDVMGDCFVNPDIIRLSERRMSFTAKIVETMAHEMVHLYIDRHRLAPAASNHGAEFRRRWRQVCKHHGFDPVDI